MKKAMKVLVLLTFLGSVIQESTARIHSLKYFYTGSSGVPDFPEFVVVGYVDDVKMIHYDSNTRRAEPKQDWMNRTTADDPQYWQKKTDIFMGQQKTFKDNMEILKQRFNQTGGVHIFQLMYGCDWDDETAAVNGFRQYGYDGEDFDLQTKTWVAPTPQAVITKQKLNNGKGHLASPHHYLKQICPQWLEKYVNYGRSSLMRTDLPSVSFLQKTSYSPIICHATGFYPNSAVMFWRKDGEELHEDVDYGETLPNPDGSFQMSAGLKPPSETSADWGRYECVFQLTGVREDQVYKLSKDAIMTNEVTKTNMIIHIIAVLLVALCLITGVIAFIKWKKRKSVNNPIVTTPQVEEMLPNN